MRKFQNFENPTGDRCFLGDEVVKSSLEQIIFSGTLDLANNLERHTKGSKFGTHNPGVDNMERIA